jgi:hypothetical protein
MTTSDVYIDSKHNALREILVGEVFAHGWELLAFAAAIGWQTDQRRDPPSSGKGNYTVKMSDESERGDRILADALAIVLAAPEHLDSALGATAALKGGSFSARCKDLCAYAHGGFEVIEARKNRLGCTYKQAVLEILEHGVEETGL